MRPPLPGMDPWLEHPAIWPDVHNSLIVAIADVMMPTVRPKYYIGLESRTNLGAPDELAVIRRPDLVEVELPMTQEVRESYLEVHDVATGALVTVIEILSPSNKIAGLGRSKYEQKRARVISSLTGLVEIDLLRAGEPMPYGARPVPPSDYRILVSRGRTRPRAQVHTFGVRDPIPTIPLPLLPGDDEPPMDLGAILNALYDRAGYDLRLDYSRPPVPPLSEEDAEWVARLG